MDKLSLVDRLANPELLKSMTTGEKVMASLQVTVLGMSITFVALMILWGLIIIMTKVLNTAKPKEKAVEIAKATAEKVEPKAVAAQEEDEELVAVITAAIAASLNTSTHNIVVRNIVRIPDQTPAWGQAGRIEQMNRML